MKISLPMQLARILACVALLAGPAGAEAGLFRAYLSSKGSDSNACTVGAPCRLLPAALAAVNDGGEIWIMDSANFNTGPVTIAKSVSILALPGALASVVAASGNALVISGSGIKVSLRNLQILNFNLGASGIHFDTGSALTVDGCEIYGVPLNGIEASAPGSLVTVRNTVVHDVGGAGISVAAAERVTLEQVSISNTTAGVVIANSSFATVTDALIATSNTGILVGAHDGSTVQAGIERTIMANNSTALYVRSDTTAGSRSNVVLRESSMANSGISISVLADDGDFVTLWLDHNVMNFSDSSVVGTNNGSGVVTVQTLGNNITQTTGGLDGAVLTPASTQ
jgi:hypothetical protein